MGEGKFIHRILWGVLIPKCWTEAKEKRFNSLASHV